MIQGKRWGAHKLALFLAHGSSVMDLHTLHECDNPRCCNPRHLVPGTHKKNMSDRNARRRQAIGERNGRAKVTKEIVLAIRAAYVPHKCGARQLAERFGVNIHIINGILFRRTWKGVEPERPAHSLTEGREG